MDGRKLVLGFAAHCRHVHLPRTLAVAARLAPHVQPEPEKETEGEKEKE